MSTQIRLVPTARSESEVDRERLAAHLRAAGIEGEVRFDDGARALYSTDASNYRQVPIGVVVPKTARDIETVFSVCRMYRVPIISRGGGTSLAGQTCNVAVVLDMSKYYNAILEIDPERHFARVQPGIVLDELRNAAERYHLTFAPDPSTHNHCTLGGMIGNNSCGVHSVMGGKTSENVEWLDVLLYDGTKFRVGPTSEEELERIIAEGGRRGLIYEQLRNLRDRYADLIRARFPTLERRVSGFALDQLLPENGFNVARALVGTEGTCVCVLEAGLRIMPSPQARTLVVLGYPDIGTAGDHVPEVMKFGPIGLEGIDDRLVEDMKKKDLHPKDVQLLPDGGGWLLVEFGADTKDEADAKARVMMDALGRTEHPPSMKLFDEEWQEHVIWTVRESGLGATARVPGEPDTWEGWEDSAVPPERLGDYLRRFRELLDRYGYACCLYGHFGQGCLHTRIDFGLKSQDGIAKFRAFLDDAADLVVSMDGSLSGEHGDGQSRAALLPKMYGDELVRAFGEFKAIWDPMNRMNPGKVVEAYSPTDNLRYGSGYAPWRPVTHFQFPDDHGDFAYAMERCVGVGECRKHGEGVMCPSYMVTREEKHSTRGRARMLWEMLQGETVTEGWKDEAVKESLDLCLACKGCKGECPMNVDMATYKAEFLSHYYARKLRPPQAYTMGLIHRWARLAALDPGLANMMGRLPVITGLGKRLAGIAPQREIPRFAKQTFRSWFGKRTKMKTGGTKVILWPDTFSNHFLPSRAKAAVAVLEAAGCEVHIPKKQLCCGRPLYDWGMLGQAEALWRETLAALRDEIRAGTPIVGLEPSCVSAFRDELVNLFPHDEDARKLASQTFLLSEYLVNKLDWQPPRLERKAVVQGHCHHQAVLKMDAERELMRRMGLEADVLNSGCCGMAGAFGFERGEKYEVSVAAAERVLVPALRQAADDTLVLADGFSCQEQIRQTGGREAMHLAEALQLALEGHGDGPGSYADGHALADSAPPRPANRTLLAGAALTLFLLGKYGRRN